MVPPDDMEATATAVNALDETPARDELEVEIEADLDALEADLAPTHLGRYVILREIGAGAIGVVYAAYHEGLDRKLAIKVLNHQRAGRADLEARLRREAKALAKLSHPNVVQVYDVGEYEGRVFVAMEFVEGQTLGKWMRRRHDIDEIIAMFVAAGRGLAAAHEAGVIHRDFKPDNVLVGADGRPRVLDFGLARAAEHPRMIRAARERHESGPLLTSLAQLLHTGPNPTRPSLTGVRDAGPASAAAQVQPLRSVPAPAPRSTANLATGDPDADSSAAESRETAIGELDIDVHDVDTRVDHDPEFAATIVSEPGPADALPDDDVVTRDGALLGTPAYMSPEQFLGRSVDQASDQFSFCIALHEALYGRRPFTGKTPMELAVQTQAGTIVEAPPHSQVPTRLRQILLRGLSPRPEDRFESMHALLDALEDEPEAPRRRRALASLGLVAIAALAVAVGILRPEREPPCPSVDAVAAELWPSEREQALAAAFARSRLAYARSTWAGVDAILDGWTTTWAEQRVDACEATHVRQEFSTEVLDLRQACLDRGRRAFDSLTEQFATGEDGVIERAVEAAAALPDPSRCADVEAITTGLEPPPEAAAVEVAQLREHLAEIDTLTNTGRWQQGLALAAAAVEQARELGYGPVIAEALLVQGRLQAQSGAGREALLALEAALDEADRHAHDELVPRVAIELASLSIYTRPDPVRGRLWARRAIAALDRIDERGHARARGIWALGNIERLDGANAQAEAHLRDAIARLDELAPDHPDRAIMLNDLGNALEAQGRFVQARETYEQALARTIASFGPGHPRVGHARYNLARLAFGEGRYAEAHNQLDEAHRIYAAALGPDHRDIGSVELLATNLALAEGDIDAAAVHARRVKDIYDAELAPDNVDRAEPDLLLGHVAFARKHYDQALAHYRTCLGVQRAALPPGHIAMAVTLTNLGLVHLSKGDLDPAVDDLGEALALLEAGERVNPDELRMAHVYLGDALLARAGAGDHRRAAAEFEAAYEGCSEPSPCARVALQAARAHAGADDRDATTRWAALARSLYLELDPETFAEIIAELDELAPP